MKIRLDDRFQRLVFRLSHRLAVDNFESRAFLPSRSERVLITERLRAALTLVREFSPVRYACLQRDLPHILVGPAPALGVCHYAIGLCLLKYECVIDESRSIPDLATTLVHEGMHARLRRFNIGYGPANRARVEAICATAELMLALRIPGAEGAVSSARARLAWPAEYWSETAIAERREGLVAEIGMIGRVGYLIGRGMRRLGLGEPAT